MYHTFSVEATQGFLYPGLSSQLRYLIFSTFIRIFLMATALVWGRHTQQLQPLLYCTVSFIVSRSASLPVYANLCTIVQPLLSCIVSKSYHCSLAKDLKMYVKISVLLLYSPQCSGVFPCSVFIFSNEYLISWST